MPQALRIFSHAVSMVFRDLGATLRATYVGVILITAAVIMMAVSAPALLSGVVGFERPEDFFEVASGGLFIPAIILMAVGYLTMIAAWHRFVLLPVDRRSEGFTPGAGIVLGYLGRSLLLGIVIALLAIPLFIPVGIVAAATGNDIAASIVAVPLFAMLGWVLLRLSLILPACTIGHKMSFGESWAASKPLAGTILVLMILIAILDFVLNFALGLVITDNLVSGLISVIVSVLYALVSASVLTTLYGIAVEGRDV